DRNILINGLKKFDLSIKMLDNIEKAIVTSGGVDLNQVSPKTFESKLVPNLYFAGEVLDIDALTGGFNLQIAFSSGYIVGNSVRLK
ncbi:MAG: NAD(P)/FAD-dependent oxidoreductase, partial [Clostridia bacterium]